MYTVVLGLHNITRWIVLIIGIAAIVRAALGWLGKKEWTALDNKLGLYFTMSMDIQILLGLLLYVVFSPITTAAFSDLARPWPIQTPDSGW